MKKLLLILALLPLCISCTGSGKSGFVIEKPSSKPTTGGNNNNGGSTTTPTVVKDPELPNNGAVARMKEMGVGWNLGNNLDAQRLARVEEVINAWTNEDPSYTLQSVYDKAPVF